MWRRDLQNTKCTTIFARDNRQVYNLVVKAKKLHRKKKKRSAPVLFLRVFSFCELPAAETIQLILWDRPGL